MSTPSPKPAINVHFSELVENQFLCISDPNMTHEHCIGDLTIEFQHSNEAAKLYEIV